MCDTRTAGLLKKKVCVVTVNVVYFSGLTSTNKTPSKGLTSVSTTGKVSRHVAGPICMWLVYTVRLSIDLEAVDSVSV